MIKTHKDLEVWKKSVDFVSRIYEVTSTFPKEEQFGLINQIRRSAVSIPSNIAEGAARDSDAEQIRFLNIAQGSLAELETQLIISEKLKFINNATLIPSIDEIRKMIWGLKHYLELKSSKK